MKEEPPGVDSTGVAPQDLPERQGIVFDRWPFRLDVDVEYQDWILVASCLLIVALWTLPCFCGRLKNGLSRRFTTWVYTRLHVFYWTILYLSLFIMMFTIAVLPDWTFSQFMEWLEFFVLWILARLVKMVTSFSILFAFWVVYKFRERLLVAAGLEHITVCRWWSWRDPLGLRAKRRPVEIFIWKVDGLKSGASKVMKANDVYVECHLGENEPMRTRVHNNAGRGCLVKESFQLNIDEGDPTALMTILVKDQSLLASVELARLVLSTAELCGIEDQTGKRRSGFSYSKDCFVPLGLSPMGLIWIAVAPVDDGDVDAEEGARLIEDDELGINC